MISTRIMALIVTGVFVGLTLFFAASAAQPRNASAEKCQGADACTGATGHIGDNSCIGEEACTEMHGDVGSNACNGYHACYYAGWQGEFRAGSGSCNGQEACAFAGYQGSTNIGRNSCNQVGACYDAGYTSGDSSIGDGSCDGEFACYYAGAYGGSIVIGNQSCIGYDACYLRGYSSDRRIGNGSCTGESACEYYGYGIVYDIGNFSCNGDANCYQNEEPVGNCQQNDSIPAPCIPPTQGPANIGAGLSGLFAAKPVQQAPAPTAVSPNTTTPVISPPNTGDAGLADEDATSRPAIAFALALILAGSAIALRFKISD
jgi:hypothetical protein